MKENCAPNAQVVFVHTPHKSQKTGKARDCSGSNSTRRTRRFNPLQTRTASEEIEANKESPASWYDSTFKEELQDLNDLTLKPNTYTNCHGKGFLHELQQFESVSNELDDLLDSILVTDEVAEPRGEYPREGQNPFKETHQDFHKTNNSFSDQPLAGATDVARLQHTSSSACGECIPLLNGKHALKPSLANTKLTSSKRVNQISLDQQVPSAQFQLQSQTHFSHFCQSLTHAVNALTLGIMIPVPKKRHAVNCQLPEV
jgi:hypothetical protein